MFYDGLNMSEFINRIITLLLRFLVRVLTPFIFYRQLYGISKSEKPLERKGKEESCECDLVVRHHYVTLISTVSHVVMFSAILLYLGAFLTVESQLKGSSMHVYQRTIANPDSPNRSAGLCIHGLPCHFLYSHASWSYQGLLLH